MQYEPHEYANIFPMMTPKEYAELLDSMKADGYHQHEPIMLYGGAILDGRNRYHAAQELNILPMFVKFDGDDEAAYKYTRATNLARKHWSLDQLAAIGLDLIPIETELAKKRKSANGGNKKSDVVNSPPPIENKGKTRKKVAESVGVSTFKIRQAQAVAKAAPELMEKVKAGTMPLKEAEKQVKAKERTAARAEIAKAGAMVARSDKWHVYQGDIRIWDAPRQYDFIITDPSYPREFLPLWEVLAQRASNWLKPGGLLVAMSGQSYLDEIYAMMSKHLQYYWTSAYLTPGQPTPLKQVNVNSTWKPLLVYGVKGGTYKGKIFGDVFVSAGNDKDFHKWGQSISGMMDIVTKMCLEGQHILDPFCGSGTTGIAALRHGCFFDGLELFEENVNISKARLSE
jgi:16S rRNA G966 N2-methylase RsmD